MRSDTSTEPGSAADCSRAAAFTASPVTIASPGSGVVSGEHLAGVHADPDLQRDAVGFARELDVDVLEATRASAAPARSARAASSSCAAGTPNAAMTASPMNFSTVPPSASISSRIADEVGVHHVAGTLGVELFAERRRAGDVGEQDRDELPFLATSGARGDELSTAGRAETGVLIDLNAARGAGESKG